MNHFDPLIVATQFYYWKPMAALFRSLELRVYRNYGVKLQGPVLDLGCGDGRVMSMLKDLEMVRGSIGGIDISAKELSKVKEVNAHDWLLQTSATCLPFESEQFSSIISNGVFCSIPGKVEQPLREVHRVLKKEGTFIMTVPTDKFIDVLLVPKVLGWFSAQWRARYVKKLNNRLPHFNVYSSEDWGRKLEDAGFSVAKTEGFFSFKSGYLWSFFVMHIMRVCGLLKVLGNKYVMDMMSRTLRKICFSSYSSDGQGGPDFGYLFIVANKR